ncbi:MAG: DUF3473 domain-containing protein [Candidatus Pacebacteria bacterium]|nr:DUF3473 domain-containing protein [Candidatus Paceibacterota bacterium]
MFTLPRKMNNILTFDIEEWYDANYPGSKRSVIPAESRIEREVKELLDLCEKYKAKATFFILGRVAEKNPSLIKLIHERSHEISSHGYGHRLVYNLSPEEFKKDLQKSLEILKSITGVPILGYRAPSWSLNGKTGWAYRIMAELGLKYSASIFPIKTSFFGAPEAPRFPYFIETQDKRILEIPTSTARILGKNLPFSGGAFFRVLPLWMIKKGISLVNKEGKPAIIYLHPREIDPLAPKLDLPFREKPFIIGELAIQRKS